MGFTSVDEENKKTRAEVEILDFSINQNLFPERAEKRSKNTYDLFVKLKFSGLDSDYDKKELFEKFRNWYSQFNDSNRHVDILSAEDVQNDSITEDKMQMEQDERLLHVSFVKNKKPHSSDFAEQFRLVGDKMNRSFSYVYDFYKNIEPCHVYHAAEKTEFKKPYLTKIKEKANDWWQENKLPFKVYSSVAVGSLIAVSIIKEIFDAGNTGREILKNSVELIDTDKFQNVELPNHDNINIHYAYPYEENANPGILFWSFNPSEEEWAEDMKGAMLMGNLPKGISSFRTEKMIVTNAAYSGDIQCADAFDHMEQIHENGSDLGEKAVIFQRDEYGHFSYDTIPASQAMKWVLK